MQGKKNNRGMAVEADNGKPADYEQVRNARIEENRRRMQELGLLNLAKEVSAEVTEVRKKRHRPQTEKKPPPVSTPAPSRRSSRLQNVTPVSYAELPNCHGKEESTHNPEIYTEQHEKLLGSYESEWVLFEDGYGLDGNRIYDAVKGKTCHQCRQKTLGLRTHCSTCDLVQGQFCGDCLYMRYGENVMEANKNPEWVCPVCRGICNCSLCRVKKGWAPTGYLYRKVKGEGFKSVAHYLILTRRSSTKSESTDAIYTDCHVEDNKDDAPLNGTRRSLAFAALPNLASCKGEENNSLINLAFCKREDNNSLPNSECCKGEENNSLRNSECCKGEENNSLPNLSCCEREENDSVPNSACGKRDLEPGEDSIICNTKRPLANEKMASRAASEVNSGDDKIISIEETKHDESLRKLSKTASQDDSGDVEIISIEGPEYDKNQRKSERHNTYIRGGIAGRLRLRITRKTSS